MWQISDRFSVSSLGVLEGFDAGWSYRSCWKCRPFTLMHSWYLRADDCVSRIIAAAFVTRATSTSAVSIGVSYTKHFISPQIKKSIGVMATVLDHPSQSNDWGKHCSGILWHQGGPWRIWRRMVLQKLLKMSSVYINAQLVSACRWLCLTHNCCSFCHTGNQLFWSVYQCLVHQTLHLSPDKEIHRSEIGRTWWPLYWATPPNPTIGENIVQVFSDIKGKVFWDPVMQES